MRVREQGDDGAVETDIYPPKRVPFTDCFNGRVKACNEGKRYVFLFDNTYSRFTEKTCVYSVIISEDHFYRSTTAGAIHSPPPVGYHNVGIAGLLSSRKSKAKILKKIEKIEAVSDEKSEPECCDDFLRWDGEKLLIDQSAANNSCLYDVYEDFSSFDDQKNPLAPINNS